MGRDRPILGAGHGDGCSGDGCLLMHPLALETLIPALMGCAMLWWVGQGMSWAARFVVSAITVVLIIAVLQLGRVWP